MPIKSKDIHEFKKLIARKIPDAKVLSTATELTVLCPDGRSASISTSKRARLGTTRDIRNVVASMVRQLKGEA